MLEALFILLAVWSLWPLCFRRRIVTPEPAQWPGVSIVVPARNEAARLPALLRSLESLDYGDVEIIVVDDHSVDGTGAVARLSGCTVITPPPLPEGWGGKSWACHHGWLHARKPLVLFTDADTVHEPASLRRAVAELMATKADLISALPYHLAVSTWERLQGVFQVLLLVATHASVRDPERNRFCIGQYLLFRRDAYVRSGGHQAIRRELAEDIALAREVRRHGGRVVLLTEDTGLRVRMYPRLVEFLGGWRRNFNHGLRLTRPLETLRVFAVMGWLLGSPYWAFTSMEAGFLLNQALVLVLLLRAQDGRGAFPPWSVVLYPAFALIYAAVSAAALIDVLLRRPIRWRDRTYAVAAEGSP